MLRALRAATHGRDLPQTPSQHSPPKAHLQKAEALLLAEPPVRAELLVPASVALNFLAVLAVRPVVLVFVGLVVARLDPAVLAVLVVMVLALVAVAAGREPR